MTVLNVIIIVKLSFSYSHARVGGLGATKVIGSVCNQLVVKPFKWCL